MDDKEPQAVPMKTATRVRTICAAGVTAATLAPIGTAVSKTHPIAGSVILGIAGGGFWLAGYLSNSDHGPAVTLAKGDQKNV